MRQLTKLQARADFRFKAGRGRPVTVLKGSRWWVTNTEVSQADIKHVLISREGRGTISNGYAFTTEQIAQLFQEV